MVWRVMTETFSETFMTCTAGNMFCSHDKEAHGLF